MTASSVPVAAAAVGPAARVVRAPSVRVRFWREPEFWLTLLLVCGIYFTRPATLTLRGEETRWAEVAREMIESGDWIVPREQGDVFPNRPPLANWCIAWSMLLFGNDGALAVRLPSLLATLLTTLLIYVCGRTFLERFGAFTAAIGYATMGQVLQLGRHAETESLFTLLTSGALLGWLACYLQNRRPWVTWSVGYALAALAALTKGPQGPIYFVGSTWLFLWCYDRSFLRQRGQLVGLAVFAAIVAAWQIPYMLATDLTSTAMIWGAESLNRFTRGSAGKVVRHALAFPWEVLHCTLPWSGVLVCFCDRSLRARLEAAKRPAQFLALSALLCLVPLLLAHAAQTRYFMPLYPCIALLGGTAAQLALAAEAGAVARRIWRAALLAGCAIALVVTVYFAWQSSGLTHWIPKSTNPSGAQSFGVVTLLLLATVAVCLCCRWAMRRLDKPDSLRASATAAYVLAVFYGLSYTVAGVNSLAAYSFDIRADVRRTLALVPGEAKLVSFVPVSHLFTYHLAGMGPRRVELVATPTPASAGTADWEYFCFNSAAGEPSPLPLPFAWEQVGVVTIDRNRYDRPRSFVVIGRKLAPSSNSPEVDAWRESSPVVRPEALEAAAPTTKRS
ncbi:MAG: glycosyltransferase family 39 protein [Planctomycetia bacterium]|nr:glycosyltransferase family 39 protein [Planctomycetia bacterium]